MTWRLEAACRGMGTDLFITTKSGTAAVRAAKAVCATCPVVDACRDEWFTARNTTGYGLPGVWFGTSEEDRRFGRAVVHGREQPYRNGCRCDRCVEAQRERFRQRAARARAS